MLITGADLVLVKMTSMTKAGSTVSKNSSTLADTATAGSARSAAGSTGSAGVSRSTSRAESGLDAAAAVAADAHASVLAQHELNKVGVGTTGALMCPQPSSMQTADKMHKQCRAPVVPAGLRAFAQHQ